MINKNITLKKYLSIFVTFLFLITISVQISAAGDLYNKKSGLPSQTAMKISVSEDKVMFAGGMDGILIYDKQTESFKSYTKKNNKHLSRVHTADFAYDKIWVGTETALLAIDEDGNITEYSQVDIPSVSRPGNIDKRYLTKIHKVKNEGGFLWLACYGVHGGLFKFDGKDFEEVTFGLSPFNYCTDVVDIGDEIWFGTISFGVYYYNKATKKWLTLNTSTKQRIALPSNSIKGIVFVDGKIWAGTGGGIVEIERNEDKFTMKVYDLEAKIGNDEFGGISTIASNDEGDIFVGYKNGISKFTGSSWDKVELSDSNNNTIQTRRVYTVESDGESLWIGSDKGIIRLH